MPSLFLEMCSLDGWKRFRVEGYAWITLPTTPGRHRLVLNSWRPASLTRRDELKRFFIGCDAEITDLTYIGVPADFKVRVFLASLNNFFLTIIEYSFVIECSVLEYIIKSIRI